MKILSLPKHVNLTSGRNIVEKEEKLLLNSNLSSFPQYFQYISNFKSPVTYIFVKCGCKSDMSRYGYLEVFQRVPWNSRTRVDCDFVCSDLKSKTWRSWLYGNHWRTGLSVRFLMYSGMLLCNDVIDTYVIIILFITKNLCMKSSLSINQSTSHSIL